MSIFWTWEEDYADMRLLVFSDSNEGWIVQCERWSVNRYLVFYTERDFGDGARAALHGRKVIFNMLKRELKG